MILGFKQPPEGPYWFGKALGVDKKFVRVITGLMMPHLDRQIGALVVLAELYRSTSTPDISGIAAQVGNWAQIQAALIKFHADTQFDHVITQDEGTAKIISFNVPQLNSVTHPCIIYPGPSYAMGEIGRQKVDALIGEGRLHLDDVERDLGYEPEQGAKALQLAVTYLLDFPAIYPNAKKKAQPQYQRMFGMSGL